MTSGQPLRQIDKARRKFYKAAEIEGADLHSLRHSFSSIGAHVQNGRFVGHVGPLLGHGYQQRQIITDRYIHADPEALRPAADAIAEEIARHLGLAARGRVLHSERREIHRDIRATGPPSELLLPRETTFLKLGNWSSDDRELVFADCGQS